jgi:spore coat protein U-like protein
MKNLSIKALRAAVATAVAVGSIAAHAATDVTTTFDVTATVADNCIIAAPGLSFGAYDPIVTNKTTARTASAAVNVTCTSGASTTVQIDQGANADTGSSDTVPLRRMTAGATKFLSYALFKDSGFTTTWGNTAATGVAHTGTGALTALTVYGSVAPGQNVPKGDYVDTVTATITF